MSSVFIHSINTLLFFKYIDEICVIKLLYGNQIQI